MGAGVTIRRMDASEANQRGLNAGETSQREVGPGWELRWQKKGRMVIIHNHNHYTDRNQGRGKF